MTLVSLNQIASPGKLISLVILHYDANTEQDRVIATYSELEREQAEKDLDAYQSGNSGAADWFRLCELNLL